jgi:uncharacterized repeat protein (TIGR03803 family)
MHPAAALILGSDGFFYGTSEHGGQTDDCMGCGTIFRLTPEGTLTVVHSFGFEDGRAPFAPLVQASNGDLYGTTSLAGPDNFQPTGSIFRFSPTTGAFAVLHQFSGPPDGSFPLATMIQASDGNLYGTTTQGGPNNWGTVYRVTPEGVYTQIAAFGTDSPEFQGAYPEGPLLQASDGYLYGTTIAFSGWRNQHRCSHTCGAVFRMSLDGKILAWYPIGGEGGLAPSGALVEAPDGYICGTAAWGGKLGQCARYGCGTIFRFSLAGGDPTLLHRFTFREGANVTSGLIRASDGNFYGVAEEGGKPRRCDGHGCGTIFRLMPDGSFSKLHTFYGPPDGGVPLGALVEGRDGALYGTTLEGGTSAISSGAIFRIELPSR